jgi:hypothetical protein
MRIVTATAASPPREPQIQTHLRKVRAVDAYRNCYSGLTAREPQIQTHLRKVHAVDAHQNCYSARQAKWLRDRALDVAVLT